MHRINLKNENVYTDLVIEQIIDKNLINEEIINNIKVSRVFLERNNTINKRQGNYITIELNDITNYEDGEITGKVLVNELKNLLEINNIKEDDECLVIGLGNKNIASDALGPITVSNILVTRHLFTLNKNVKKGIRKISAITTDVMGNTGIESMDIIKGVINNVKPKFIIVIDSLCASSIERLNKTIQLTDTGINPGSGIGNNRKEINEETLGIKVIALGIPTVVNIQTIVSDTLDYMFMHLNYLKNNYETSKLTFKRDNNYLNKIKENNISMKDKELIGGIIGSLNNNDKINLIKEVLDSVNYNLIVTTKDIDFLIQKLSDVISSSINNALSNEVDNY